MLLNKKGFTLIEVLVVVLIIGILAALAAPNIIGRIEQARITNDTALAKTLENAVASFLVDTDAAGTPSTPPPAADFVTDIVNSTYLDRDTCTYITTTGNTDATLKFTTADAVPVQIDVLCIKGKAKGWMIVYIPIDESYTVTAVDTAASDYGTKYPGYPSLPSGW